MIASPEDATLLFKKWAQASTVLRVILASEQFNAMLTCPARLAEVTPSSLILKWELPGSSDLLATEGHVSLVGATFSYNTAKDVPPKLREVAEAAVDSFVMMKLADGGIITLLEHRET